MGFGKKMQSAQIRQVTCETRLTKNDLLQQLLGLFVPEQNASVHHSGEVREDVDDLRRSLAIPVGEPLDDYEDAHVPEDASEEQDLRDELEEEVEARSEVDCVESLQE